MKKLFYTVVLGGIFCAAMASCNKCGHCEQNGSASSSKTCQSSNPIYNTVYSSAKANCETGGGKWVTE